MSYHLHSLTKVTRTLSLFIVRKVLVWNVGMKSDRCISFTVFFFIRQSCICSAVSSSTLSSPCFEFGVLCFRAWQSSPSTKRGLMKIFVSTQVELACARRCLSSRRQLADTCLRQIALADFCCSRRLRHRHLAWGRCCTGRCAAQQTWEPGADLEGRK